MFKHSLLPLFCANALVLSGCATDDPYVRTKTGAAVGAVAGAVIGHQVDDESGKFVGAVAGALAGGAVGNYMDRQQAEFERVLREEQQNNALEIERLENNVLKLNVNSEVSFDFNSADLKAAFFETLENLAGVLRTYDRTVVHVIGHTDDVGSRSYNQTLSTARANAVGAYLLDNGVPASRLRSQGRGEDEPRDSNESEAGRQLNRRVELFVKPIVRGQEQDAWKISAS